MHLTVFVSLSNLSFFVICVMPRKNRKGSSQRGNERKHKRQRPRAVRPQHFSPVDGCQSVADCRALLNGDAHPAAMGPPRSRVCRGCLTAAVSERNFIGGQAFNQAANFAFDWMYAGFNGPHDDPPPSGRWVYCFDRYMQGITPAVLIRSTWLLRMPATFDPAAARARLVMSYNGGHPRPVLELHESVDLSMPPESIPLDVCHSLIGLCLL